MLYNCEAAANRSQEGRRVRSSFDPFPIFHLTNPSVLQRVAGKNGSKQFWKYHNEGILKKYKGRLQVGSLAGKQAEAPPTPPATPPAPTEEDEKVVEPERVVELKPEPGTVSAVPGPEASASVDPSDTFGRIIPYSDPSWYQSVCSEPWNLH